MMKIKEYLFSQCIVVLLFIFTPSMAQYPVKIHSHNDYARTMPFYEAYSQKIYSLEVDMFYRNGEFFVGHDEIDLTPDKTFSSMYLQPLVSLYKINGGKAWANSNNPIQLMIEIKSTDTESFMRALVKILEAYPEVFNPEKNPNAVKIVITGAIPEPEEFENYPYYIQFDGDLTKNYTHDQLKRIAVFSANFADFSDWNGKGSLIKKHKINVLGAIEKAHQHEKPMRFWGAPDGMTAWNTLFWLGADYINTDKVERCSDFFSNWDSKNYGINGKEHSDASKIIKTDRLDKTTHNFKGFSNDKIQLSDNIEVYQPSYKNDGENRPVKNVIFLIGDGMGLAQITAADRINNGLSILMMKYLGLINTSSKDAFTTDSAGAGSAFATGKSNSNRHISISDDGIPYPLLTDFFVDKGKSCGVVTLGNITDATPAAFYGHNTERDNSDALTRYLLDEKLTLLAGSGIDVFTQRKDNFDIVNALKAKGYTFTNDVEQINDIADKEICIDETMGKAADTENIDLLARATKHSIEKLHRNNPKGFFLMVEGAKIDYAGHAKYFPGSILETLSFDKAVGEALKFADQNGETLVIVTGDHETGGLTLIDGDLATRHITAYYVTDDHTPIMIPVFAYGPQSDKFIGKYMNYEIHQKIQSIIK